MREKSTRKRLSIISLLFRIEDMIGSRGRGRGKNALIIVTLLVSNGKQG